MGDSFDFAELARDIKRQALALGFSGVGISNAKISPTVQARLHDWLESGHHGGMDYMAKHADLRGNPQTLCPGTLTVISVRLPYWPQFSEAPSSSAHLACISRYALGRDYHKTVRQRLQQLATHIQSRLNQHEQEEIGKIYSYRVFSDSAPVMETEFALQSGIGWRGKHTLTLSRHGSWHFLGEIYTNLPLPVDTPAADHCGRCNRCLDACPTGAIIAPYRVDARRCISYLTIELQGSIPVELRSLIGNRIYGCDDCQQCCPWNRFAQHGDADFAVRNGLTHLPPTELFAWTREEFERRFAGSAIRRIGYERWLRNLAVALGNAPPSHEIGAALHARRHDASAIVREHIAWAQIRHPSKTDERS